LIALPLKTAIFGTLTYSLFDVLTLVTNIIFSITSPVASTILTHSPILKARISVITKPAIILPTAEDDFKPINTPINTLKPLSIGELPSGQYDNITTSKNA